MTTSPYKRPSVEEYLAIARAADSKSESCDENMFAMCGGSADHRLTAANVGAESRSAHKGRPCRVDTSDMPVKASAGRYTNAEVSAVCGAPRCEANERHSLLNSSVVVDVLAPSRQAYDPRKKFEVYRTIPAIQAYALIAQDRRRVEHFVRRGDGRWLLTALAEGEVEFASLGGGIAVDENCYQVEFLQQSVEA